MAKDDIKGKTPTIAEIMEVLARIGERFNNIDKLLDRMAVARETADKRQEEGNEAARQRQEAADQRQKAADQQAQATEKQVQETSKELQAVGKYVRELGKQLGGQGQRWGKIIESLVEGDLCMLMTEFLGVEIVDISRRVEVRDVEIDLVAVNTETVVVVEVKTTLQREHIDKFISTKLSRFADLRPRYRGTKIYGVIAFVKVDNNAKEVIDDAIGKGLIVIKAMRGTNHIINSKDSKPRNFHP